ncbi:MAG: hypothetical protein JW888_12580 [Pirellulales bacterium]|nr:hypothetical protein [Pirellulales bacterium]
MIRNVLVAVLLLVGVPSSAVPGLLPGFAQHIAFDEQVRWTRLGSGVRVFVDAPATLTAAERLLVVYATPNGNTLEQTLGCARAKELDGRYDIQHVAAQIRRYRQLDTARDVILAVVQSPQLSWPSFRRDQRGADNIIRELVVGLTKEFAADRVVLACHSGGGSFVLGYVGAVRAIDPSIERIVLLDANYAYSDDRHHGDRLLKWLDGDPKRHLVIVAYDDREITFKGQKIVGPTGGTFRASGRMLDRFRRDLELTEKQHGAFRHTTNQNGQIQFFIHPNPENKILHTALVGEMNGLLHGMTLGTEWEAKWGRLGGPRAYTDWVQPQPFVETEAARPDAPELRLALPNRPAAAPTGSAFRRQLAGLSLREREEAVAREVARGNVPEFLRRLIPIRVTANDEALSRHTAVCYVTCDYLAVGTDEDFFRVPMTANAAAAIADALDCSLLTTKLSDDVFEAADFKLQPRPLTKDRETVATFFKHHRLIEKQLAGKPRGSLVAGIKKDVVLTNRLKERPHKVAIYGWHYPGGQPIQPLYIGHGDRYVDYSHGVRLVANRVLVDGSPREISDVLAHQRLSRLLSNEGPIDMTAVRRAAGWKEPTHRND